MNSDQVYEVIEQIGSTGSRTEKESLIKQHLIDQMFRDVVKLAYDPFITFGMANLPNVMSDGRNETFDHGTFEILNHLATRDLTGTAAWDAVAGELARLSGASSTLLGRIITKDLRAGFTAKTINKAKKGLIPVFECMLAHKYEEARIKEWPQIIEPKLDGVRTLAIVKGRSVKFVSRTGKEFTSFEHLADTVLEAVAAFEATMPSYSPYLNTSGFVLDGEMVSGNFNETVSQVRKKDTAALDAEFHIFDLLPLQLFTAGKAFPAGYMDRRQALEQLVQNAGEQLKAVPRYFVNSHAEIRSYYDKVRARGLEGLIVKPPQHIYQCKRSHSWQKVKNEETHDLTVTGAFEGEGKYEGMLGGLVVDFNGVSVRVGGGFSDQQRQEFWAAYLNDLLLDYPELLLGRMIEVEAHEVTPDGSLRHPRFVRFRSDKQEAAA